MIDQLHKEHRQRMKKRFKKFGLDSFQDHEALELLLFYALPYKNTNGIAHEMLNKFGSFSGVFSANAEELKSISGIGDHAALLIELIPALFRRYSADVMSKNAKYEGNDCISEYVINHFIGQTKEHVQLFLFDSSMRRIDSITVYDGHFGSVGVNSESIAEYVFSNKASGFVIAHNHPSGDVTPSYEDMCVTRKIYRDLAVLNREMIEHYIVADGKCNPILDKAKELFDK